MSAVRREGRALLLEDVPLATIARDVGTPVYAYSTAHIEHRYHALQNAFSSVDHRICYAVKANGNLSILRLLVNLGAGFDIVSGGELQRVVRAGGDPAHVVFSGVGKRSDEINYALKLGIDCFNVESAQELDRVSEQARLLGSIAPISIRVNPDVDAQTHPYISTGLKENKFGVPIAQAEALYHRAHNDPYLRVVGVDCHIGSQIRDREPLMTAMRELLRLADTLGAAGIDIAHLDLGGGMAVGYGEAEPLDVAGYGQAVKTELQGRPYQIVLEPGRFLVADAGVLITRVEYLKPAPEAGYRNFAVVDAAMNDLIRPALYGAWHPVSAVEQRPGDPISWDIVGPVCESGDFIARDRDLVTVPGDLLAIECAGAYGMVLASNYNARGRAAEVLVDGADFRTIRRRETTADLLRLEECP